MSGSNACLTATVTNGLIPSGGLEPLGTLNFDIVLKVSPNATVDNLTNVAEISGSRDLNGLTQDDDYDSTADDVLGNDAGGLDNLLDPTSMSDDVVDGDGSGMPLDPDAATDEDDSDPETVSLQLYSLGNQVWIDANNNGVVDATENGIENVEVVLLKENENGQFVIFATTTTDANGQYLFDSLTAGNYIVALEPTQLGMSGTLSNYVSSTGSGPDLTMGTYENNTFDIDGNIVPMPFEANSDINTDDNGIFGATGTILGSTIFSDTVFLGMTMEPEMETNDVEDTDNDPLTDDNAENLTIDFGLVPLHSIGNQVWVDVNNNGMFDAGEAPIAGVEVVLHYVDPATGMCVVVDTLYTDVNGLYLFDSLIAGDYLVEITAGNFEAGEPLVGFASSTGSGATDLTSGQNEDADNQIDPDDLDTDGDDNGVLNGNPMFVGSVVSDTLTLGDGEPMGEDPNNDTSGALEENSNLTVDFGFVPLMSLGNQVWNDENNNGVIDGGEDPIEGVEVVLHYYDPATMMCVVIDTVYTDENGLYLFDSLIQGDYIVEITADNFEMDGPLEAFASSTGGGATMTSSGPYEVAGMPIDEDLTMLDGDDNGVLNANPMFVGSVVSDTVSLVWSSMGEEPTDEDPNNDMSGAADQNSNLQLDFGFIELYSLGNQVWEDLNNNGTIDDGEDPIPGVLVELHYYNPETMMCEVVGTATTDMDGLYLFDSLLAGDYIVVLPASNFAMGGAFENYVSSTGGGATNLASGTYEDSMNPLDPDSDLDNDDNGVFDLNAMFPGAIASDTITLGGDPEPGDEDPDNDLLTVDENENLTIDFGLVPLHSIGNQVWVDLNNNGMFDAGEAPIAGVEVVLHYVDPVTNMCVVIDTLYTDANGLYLFDSLIAGDYLVEITAGNFESGEPLEGFASSTGSGATDLTSGPNEDADNQIDPDDLDTDGDDNGVLNGNPMFVGSVVSDTLSLGDGEPMGEDPNNDTSTALDENSNLTVDFGFVPLMSLGNQVWNDENNNGVIDAGEDPIEGVEVVLHYYDPATMMCVVIDTVYTDINGLYLFDSLIPGDYIVEIPAANFDEGGALEGQVSSTGSGPTSLTNGPNEVDGMPIDEDVTMVDGDDNGVFNANPMFIGSVVSDTVSLVWIPAGTEPTGENPDNDMSGALDENSNLQLDFGFTTIYSIGNQVWIDDNFNGIKDGSEMGIADVVVELHYYNPTTMMCEVIAMDTTDANGLYLFDSLLMGQYIVVIPGSQLMPGGPLQDYLSSSGTFNMGGIYENPGVDPDTNIDNDDNGTFNTNPMFFFGVVSDTIDLGDAPEPMGENPDNDMSGAADDNSNLTVDFGFIPKVFDLALRKTSLAMIPIDAFNAQVEFQIQVINQGNMDAQDIEISDYIASGFSYLPALNNPLGWALSGSTAKRTIEGVLPAGQDITISIFLSVQMSSMSNAFANHAEISYAADTLGNDPDGGPYGPLVDIDSTPDDTNGNDAGSDGTSADNDANDVVDGDGTGTPDDGDPDTDEDDADPAIVRIVDIAMKKTIVTPGPYVYGQNVTFEIQVENQGNVPLRNIKISDYIPNGLMYNTSNNAAGWMLSGTTAMYTITDTLDMWETKTVTISLKINQIIPATNATEDSWTNVSEISRMEGMLTPDMMFGDVTAQDVDGTIDSNPNNNNGGEANTDDDDYTGGNGLAGEDDDHSDPALVEIYDVALTKKFVDPTAIYVFGDVIPMNIEVINQGNTDLYQIEVTDYIPASLTTVGAPANAGWAFAGASGPTTGTYTIAGPLAPGASVIVPLSLVFQSADAFEDYINFAEVSEFFNGPGESGNTTNGDIADADSSPDNQNDNDDGGVPSFPGAPSNTDNYVDGNGLAPGGAPGQDVAVEDEDDHDPLLLGFVDLALTKVVNTQQIEPGGTATFTVEVTNQGTIPSGSITVTDYIPVGFELSNPSDWTDNGDGTASITLSVANGDFASPGLQYQESVSVEIDLVALPTTQRGAYVNYAEISGNTAPNGTDILDLDIDSDGDTDPSNDDGGEPSAPDDQPDGTDNTIDNEEGDEDDHDPAVVCITPRPNIVGDFYVCSGDVITYNLEEFAEGIPYYNPDNTYTWSIVNGPAVIVGSNSGTSVTLEFSDDEEDRGEKILIKIVERTGFEFCMGMDTQTIVIEELLPLTCNDLVNISVDEDCEALITPKMILESQPYPDDSYSVNITLNGVPVSNPLSRAMIGKTLQVSIVQDCYGQSCWGSIKIEDKIGPTIDCGDPVEIKCYEVEAFLSQTKENATYRPVMDDNCDAITILSMTTIKNLVQCGDGGTLSRTWVISDASGNTASCTQEFEVDNDVDWRCPLPTVELSCNADVSPSAIASARGAASAFPHFINGSSTLPVNGVCMFNAAYKDSETPACGPGCDGNKKIVREWKVLNWCTGEIFPCTQIIKAVDTEAPTFTVIDTTVSTAPWTCEGDFFVPNPRNLHDNCDSRPSWSVRADLAGVQILPALLNGQPHPYYKYRISGAPKGELTLIYTSKDCCGNEREVRSIIRIVDQTAPTPVTKRDIIVGLVPDVDANGVSNGVAKLYASSVDNGSYDNCTDVRLEIRRPDGGSCGNEGTNGHNNNSTYSNLLSGTGYSSNDTDGGEFVKFCCNDLTSAGADYNGDGVNDAGYHRVMFRVWDDANMDGIIGNAGDNWNESWTIVKVESKTPPQIICPGPATVQCDQLIETFESSSATKSVIGVDFSRTGLPTAQGVCSNIEIRFRDRLELNSCKIGKIYRTFVIIENGVSRTCDQLITVGPSLSTQVWTITTPSNWGNIQESSCNGPTSNDIEQYGPISVGGPCDAIGVSTQIDTFQIEQGVCRKWRVEYRYINWCTNEERGPYYKYFKYIDRELPRFVGVCRDTMYAVDKNCEWTGSISKAATDNGGCIPNDPNRWLKWNVKVDLWGDGTNDLEYTSFVAVGNDVNNLLSGNISAIRDDNGDGVKDVYLAPTRSGEAVSVRLPKIEGSMSNHKVTWKVTDGCDNYASCDEFFMVVDKKAPTPVCVPLTTALMADPDGSGPLLPMVELWAIDFVVKTEDNCTEEDKILHTFDNVSPQVLSKSLAGGAPNVININTAHYFNATGGLAPHPIRTGNANDASIRDKYLRGEEGIQLWIPGSRSSAKVWTSNNLVGSGPTKVDVAATVWDEKLNHDFCWTTLELALNSNRILSGNVSTEAGTPVRNVEVIASANLPEYPKVDVTDASGNYAMESVVETELQGHKDGDDINGVSTLDLVMIQRHILGLSPLNSGYKVIAADATNDGRITAADLTEIRKLILGVTNEYTNNTSWRFPVKEQQMNASNPFPYAERIVVGATQISTGHDFVAVKIGDVNGNASTNGVQDNIESRTKATLGMEIESRRVEKNEIVTVPVKASHDIGLYGYQTTIELSGMEYVSIDGGVLELNGNNVGLLETNRITMSYAGKEKQEVKAGDVLFTLTLKAKESGTVEKSLSLSSSVTRSESYLGEDMQVGNVELGVRSREDESDIILMQNEPNPWKGETTVSWYMPKAAKAKLIVYDATGKIVDEREVNGVQGRNAERYTKAHIPSPGVYFYKLESGTFTQMKKMIIVE
jgi:uncharacterized repeat protein (TIGR01451 family)